MNIPGYSVGEKSPGQKIGLIIGPILFIALILFMKSVSGYPKVVPMAAVAALMAIWWITDAIPLFATALLPIVLFPVLGIMDGKTTAPVYFNSTILLFLGGFMIALAMEKWNLHKRMALFIIRIIGGGPSRIILGFMAASAFLSMWISNTATAIMMVPIGMAIVLQMEENIQSKDSRKFTVGLMLGIAYSCSIGGIATLVGTPPNLSFARIFQITFPEAEPISFGVWILMGLPFSLIMLVLVWGIITKIFFRIPAHVKVDPSIIENEYRALGSMGFEEKTVLWVFSITAFLWVFRSDLNLVCFSIPGWSSLLAYPKMIDDGTVAIFMAMTLFLLPARDKASASLCILDSGVIRKLPWDIVLLFGGGFALAKGFQDSGLSFFIGQKFAGLAGISPFPMILITCLGMTFLTELTSNTATTEMILPILASVGVAMKTNPLVLMIPATISASCAFMMPVATPPNAIIFGSGRVKIAEMARAGLLINIIAAVVLSVMFYFLGSIIFSIDMSGLPQWAMHLSPGMH
ncbi:MAG: DASS family sodium-coupled anion symporter [Desulfobacteraceae bacterium]|nr:DASS family sodium-coupled anion symporter [Desulfobacteraceae bacterium]